MSFDIPQIHLPDNSPEAQVIEAIINRDHVSAEEAVRRALRGLAPSETAFDGKSERPDYMAILARAQLSSDRFKSREEVEQHIAEIRSEW